MSAAVAGVGIGEMRAGRQPCRCRRRAAASCAQAFQHSDRLQTSTSALSRLASGCPCPSSSRRQRKSADRAAGTLARSMVASDRLGRYPRAVVCTKGDSKCGEGGLFGVGILLWDWAECRHLPRALFWIGNRSKRCLIDLRASWRAASKLASLQSSSLLLPRLPRDGRPELTHVPRLPQ